MWRIVVEVRIHDEFEGAIACCILNDCETLLELGVRPAVPDSHQLTKGPRNTDGIRSVWPRNTALFPSNENLNTVSNSTNCWCDSEQSGELVPKARLARSGRFLQVD